MKISLILLAILAFFALSSCDPGDAGLNPKSRWLRADRTQFPNISWVGVDI
jgi:hypothetical protein